MPPPQKRVIALDDYFRRLEALLTADWKERGVSLHLDGLDEALAEKIFLPFFTTKSDGSGIGLPLARQVMAMHKGSISARPRPGGGAVFQLRF